MKLHRKNELCVESIPSIVLGPKAGQTIKILSRKKQYFTSEAYIEGAKETKT